MLLLFCLFYFFIYLLIFYLFISFFFFFFFFKIKSISGSAAGPEHCSSRSYTESRDSGSKSLVSDPEPNVNGMPPSLVLFLDVYCSVALHYVGMLMKIELSKYISYFGKFS